MKHSESLSKLAAALAAAQAEMPTISKNATNPAFRSKFANLDGILETIRPVLARHGLSIVQGATTPDRNEAGGIAAFTVETMLLHTSGEWITSGAIMPLVKQDPQGAGSAMTYGRRYSVSALLALATDEDDDANAASKPQAARRSTSPAQSAVAKPAPQTEAGASTIQLSQLETLIADKRCPTVTGDVVRKAVREGLTYTRAEKLIANIETHFKALPTNGATAGVK